MNGTVQTGTGHEPEDDSEVWHVSRGPEEGDNAGYRIFDMNSISTMNSA